MEPFNTIGYTIFNIPGYLFFTGVGVVASVCTFIILLAEKKYSLPQNMRFLFWAAICVILFSRVFGCLSGIYRDIGNGVMISKDVLNNTGIVYYGGLIGLLISYKVFSIITKQDPNIINVVAVCIPFFHSFARVGCFFGGCCFGIESHCPIAINYTTEVLNNVITAYRVPIQLIEATFNLCLFLYLLHLIRREGWEKKHLLRRYLLIYSVGRFIIEFFRGDQIRGVIHGISFSQLISILIWIYLLITVGIIQDHTKKRERV